MMNIKILVCCHKETERLHDDIFTPILLGSEYADDTLKQAFKDDFWDNMGDNIGRLHPYCAELTGIYWAWKNYDQLGNPDYIGLHHYRRFLNYSDPLGETDNWKCAFFDFDKTTCNRFGWNRESIEKLCEGEKLILPLTEQITDPHDWVTPADLETHYKHSHYPEDLDTAVELIKQVHPEYSTTLDAALKSGYGHFCNMFIMTRELFFDYAEWLFSIILPLETILPVTSPKYKGEQKRVLGFLGERLFNVWITRQTESGVRLRETQRLTGYLTEADKAHFQSTYGMEEYARAYKNSKRFDVRNTVFDRSTNADNVIFHAARSKETPLVSILVPVYNVEPFLRECCESLVNQTLENIEIVFVNDASTDNSLEILQEYYEKDPRVVLIEHKQNEGLPCARNTALRYMRGIYFSCIDSDDVCDVTMFEKMYRKAEELSADIVTCCVYGFFESTAETYYHRPLEWYGDSDKVLSLKGRPQQLMEPAAWCKLFRTDYIKRLDYFEFRPKTRSWEDVPAMTSAFCQTDKIATVQEPLYFYRQRRAGNISSNMTKRNTDEFISGAILQQAILDEHHFFDEEVQSYIEEFKFLFAEWSLTKMRKSDIPYFFHRVPSLFRKADRKYLQRVFSLYPHRKRFYTILMTRSVLLYYVARFGYHTLVKVGNGVKKVLKAIKRGLKKIFNVRRDGVYWAFGYGFLTVRLFKKAYYRQTIDWYQDRVRDRDQLFEAVSAGNSRYLALEADLSDVREKCHELAEENDVLSTEKKELSQAKDTLETVNKALENTLKTVSAERAEALEEKKSLQESLNRQNESLEDARKLVEDFKSEFDGYYHAVWTTGWISVWKQYYYENYKQIPQLIERLNVGLDPLSVETVLRHCKRNFELLPTKENTELYRFNHARLYTQDELNGAKQEMNFDACKERYYVPENANMETPVWKFHCGLKALPESVLNQIRGNAVIDGGAYWGDSALIFSEYDPSEIIAFEPQPDTFEQLKEVVEKNHLQDVIIPRRFGLSDKKGVAQLYTSEMQSGANLYGIDPEGKDSIQSVDTIDLTTIDDYVKENGLTVGLIKLDVEGNEYNVISGALETIRRDKPVLAISIYHSPKDFFEIKPMLEQENLGYRFLVRKLSYHDLVTEVMLIGYVE